MRELWLARDSSLPSISPFIFLPVRIMKMIMVMTKKAAASMTQPSTTSSLRCKRETRTATPMLPTNAAPRAAKTDFRRSLRPILVR